MRSIRRLLVSCALLVTCVLSLSACGITSAEEGRGENRDGPGSDAPTAVIDVSRTHLYSSLAELAGDSSTVVEGVVHSGSLRVGPATRDSDTAIPPAQELTLDVVRTLAGIKLTSIDLHLLTSDSPDAEFPPPLKEGTTYVLFLTPFEWTRGEPTGLWTVPGGVGIYNVTGSGRLELVSRGSDPLPSSVGDVDDMQDMIGSR